MTVICESVEHKIDLEDLTPQNLGTQKRIICLFFTQFQTMEPKIMYCGGTGTDSTNQHLTDNYRYSNGQKLRVYWLYWGDKWIPIYTRQVNWERWPVDCPRGWNAGLMTRDPCVGGPYSAVGR